MPVQVLAMGLCLSVSASVTSQYCIETAARIKHAFLMYTLHRHNLRRV